jgi:hypothetical protein
VDAASEIPGQALVHGDFPVLVHADEVRPRERPERNGEDGGHEGQPQGGKHRAAAPVRLAGRSGRGTWRRLLVERRPPFALHDRGRSRSGPCDRRRLEAGERVLEVLVLPAAVPRGDHRVLELAGPPGHSEKDDCDVVLSARLVCRLYEPFACLLEVAGPRHEVAYLLVIHHRGEPIGADEEEVIALGLDRERVDVDFAVRPERTGDHRPLRMGVRLLRGDASASHEVRDEGVVVGELLELPATQPICAGVANVADDECVAGHERGGDRRAHARHLRVACRALVDPPVRLLDDRGEPLLWIEIVRVVELAEGGRRQSGGHLAGLSPTHAVGDCEKRGVDEEGILVSPPLAAGIGESGCVRDLHRSNLSSVSPIWTRSPRWSCLRPSTRSPFTKVPFVEPRSRIHTPSR